MPDRDAVPIGGTAELREHGGWLVGTLISAVSRPILASPHAAQPGGAEGRGPAVAGADKLCDAGSSRGNWTDMAREAP